MFVLMGLCSCKKTGDDVLPGAANKPLLTNGSMSPSHGKRINVDWNGHLGIIVWGQNSNELFVSAGSQLLHINFWDSKVKALQQSGGTFIGKTNENSAVIFLADVNGQRGYHAYNFNTRSVEKIISFSSDGSILNIAGNTMFYHLSTYGPPSNPCTGPLDFGCSNAPTTLSSSLYHVDKITKELTELPGKAFLLFSKDGTKAILREGATIHIFDIATKTIVASTLASWNTYSQMSLYYDEVLKRIELHGNSQDQIVIKNAITNQEINSLTSNAKDLHPEGIRWSEDGTKLYYVGSTSTNANAFVINVYDLITNQEKTILSFFPPLESGVRHLPALSLSSDNKRILLRYSNELYIKDL